MTVNLNQAEILETDFDNIKQKTKQLSDFSITRSAQFQTKVIFRNLETELIHQIKSADVVVGCIAWLTHEGLLKALSKPTNGVSILIQKEDFLRKDIDATQAWVQEMHQAYSKLCPFNYRANNGWLETTDSLPGETYVPNIAIRCIGEYSEKDRTIPRMHHKFLVFCNSQKNENGTLTTTPYAAWTGSFNLTKNATKSFENAVLIFDEKIASAYYKEWEQLLFLSEDLNWHSPSTCSNVRLNTGEYFT